MFQNTQFWTQGGDDFGWKNLIRSSSWVTRLCFRALNSKTVSPEEKGLIDLEENTQNLDIKRFVAKGSCFNFILYAFHFLFRISGIFAVRLAADAFSYPWAGIDPCAEWSLSNALPTGRVEEVIFSRTRSWKFRAMLLIFAATFGKYDRGRKTGKVQHYGVSWRHYSSAREL